MTVKRLAFFPGLALAIGVVPGCGPATTPAPLTPEAKAKSEADGEAASKIATDAVIQRYYFQPSAPSYDPGFQR